MARVVGVIWVWREEVYFCNRGWTGQITLKSLQKINFRRIGNLPVGRKKDHAVGCTSSMTANGSRECARRECVGSIALSLQFKSSVAAHRSRLTVSSRLLSGAQKRSVRKDRICWIGARLIGFARALQNMASQSRMGRQIWDELNGSVVKTAHLDCVDWSQTSLRTWTFSSYHAFDHCSISLLREAARCLAHFIPLCS
jgi:hypothetical protein